MTSPQARKGRHAERAVADYLRTVGFPYAEPTRRSGFADDRGDIDGLPSVVIEVKNCKRFELATWMAETEAEVANAGATHGILVVKRRLHASPAGWYTISRLSDWAALAKAAGL